MLNGTLALHDIQDIEAYCATILNQHGLNGPDREDNLAHLIEEAWILSERKPQPWTHSFSGWARPLLHLRLIDNVRKTKGDWRYKKGRQRHQYQHIPLDHPLVNTLPTSPLDDPTHSEATLLRQLRNRDSTRDRPYPLMGKSPTRRAA